MDVVPSQNKHAPDTPLPFNSWQCPALTTQYRLAGHSDAGGLTNTRMTSNDELLYYMLGQVNQERDWDLPQALCATCHWQREREPKILR
jgi:hypothetical protein